MHSVSPRRVPGTSVASTTTHLRKPPKAVTSFLVVRASRDGHCSSRALSTRGGPDLRRHPGPAWKPQVGVGGSPPGRHRPASQLPHLHARLPGSTLGVQSTRLSAPRTVKTLVPPLPDRRPQNRAVRPVPAGLATRSPRRLSALSEYPHPGARPPSLRLRPRQPASLSPPDADTEARAHGRTHAHTSPTPALGQTTGG